MQIMSVLVCFSHGGEAVWASGASPRTCRGAVGFPLLSVMEEIVQVAEQIVDFPVTEQMVAVFVPQMRLETVEVIQLMLVERIKDRDADASCRFGNRGIFAEGGEVVPTRTRATDRRANCGGASYTNSGGHWRRDRERPRSTSKLN